MMSASQKGNSSSIFGYNKSMKRVLCFGDSLTHGSIPNGNGPTFERYEKHIRWTGVLASLLGDGYEVIEEGLPSRTIGLDDTRPGKQGRNGSLYFRPCLESHTPIDILVLWIGTNNTKDMFSQSPEETTTSLRKLLADNQDVLNKQNTKVVLLSPPKMDTQKASQYYAEAAPKLEKLPTLYKDLATELGMEFVDMYDLLDMPTTADGIHLSEDQNKQVADIVLERVTQIS